MSKASLLVLCHGEKTAVFTPTLSETQTMKTTHKNDTRKIGTIRRKHPKHTRLHRTRFGFLLFGSRAKRIFWAAVSIVILFYIFLFYTFMVIPASVRSRWKALYGDTYVPEGFSIHGIDVSHYQGNIRWQRVAEARIDGQPVTFVIIKATEGKSILDVNFNENFYQAREYGLIRGAYHYFSPVVDGRTQAEYYLHQVHLDEGDLPPVLDIEKYDALTSEGLRYEALQWLRTVEERYHTTPIIYTGLRFRQQHLDTPEFQRYPFWIAHYYVPKLGYKGPWRFWQHTDLGHVDGIQGPVDLNIYNGSMYELRKLTIGHGEPPAEL